MNELPAKIIPPDTAEAFFAQQESLEMDYVRSHARSEKRAWRIAGVGVVICLMQTVAIISLAEVHTVEWRLIAVDSAGPVGVMTTLDDAGMVIKDINKSTMLEQYVRTRESYYATEVDYNYSVVGLQSAPLEQQRYARAMQPTNPESPLKVYGRQGYVRVKIESSTLLSPNLGQVFFAREEHIDPVGPAKVTRWIATIGYSLHPDAKMDGRDRPKNPLGLQVMTYRTDAVTK